MLGIGLTASADDAASSLVELELMLKQWGQDGPFLFTKRQDILPLVSDTANYTIITDTPLRIIEARYRDANGIDLPMQPLTRDEYITLPDKSSNGIPTTYYFDVQASGSELFVWPVLLVATTQAIVYTMQRRIEDIDDLDNNLDIPQEWLGVVGYCLADRLLDDYGVSDKVGDRITARAQEMLQKAKDFEREEFTYFRPGFYRY